MALAPRFHTVIAGPARKNDPQVIEAIMAAAVKPGCWIAQGNWMFTMWPVVQG